MTQQINTQSLVSAIRDFANGGRSSQYAEPVLMLDTTDGTFDIESALTLSDVSWSRRNEKTYVKVGSLTGWGFDLSEYADAEDGEIVELFADMIDAALDRYEEEADLPETYQP